MSAKMFTPADEVQIIDFVKSNEVLHNVRLAQFRDSEAKNRLWQKLSITMGKDANLIKKHWGIMRDYFVRGQHKKTTGSTAAIIRRNEGMMFLNGVQRPSPSRSTTLAIQMSDDDATQMSTHSCFEELLPNPLSYSPLPSVSPLPSASFVSSVSQVPSDSPETSPPPPKRNRKSHHNSTAEDLFELLSQDKPKPVELPPLVKPDGLALFFDYIAETMRSFSPVTIAEIRMQISNIVNAKDLEYARKKVVNAPPLAFETVTLSEIPSVGLLSLASLVEAADPLRATTLTPSSSPTKTKKVDEAICKICMGVMPLKITKSHSIECQSDVLCTVHLKCAKMLTSPSINFETKTECSET